MAPKDQTLPKEFVRVQHQSPYCAEWPVLDELTGDWNLVQMFPEDILPEILEGYPPVEIARKFKAPLAAVEHVITLIPAMMAWRDTQIPSQTGVELDHFLGALPEPPEPSRQGGTK